MTKELLAPRTLEGIKRLAKNISKETGQQHSRALDSAALCSGYQNFAHARRMLSRAHEPNVEPQTFIFITGYWYDHDTKEGGRETLKLRVSKPLEEIITTAQLRVAAYLSRFRRVSADHLVYRFQYISQQSARHFVCQAARALQFMDATGLKPSTSRKLNPNLHMGERLPGIDHSTVWRDPETGQIIVVDEPYGGGATWQQERDTWSRRHGWEIIKPSWSGIYFPDGGTEFYLLADVSKGNPLQRIATTLDKAPTPVVASRWNGESAPWDKLFSTPGEIASAKTNHERKKSSQKVTKKISAKTIGYHSMFGNVRRKPDTRMPVEAHSQIGKLLMPVLGAAWKRQGVRNRLETVRSELDDWVQKEYLRTELSDEVFHKLYYGDVQHRFRSNEKLDIAELTHKLSAAERILKKHYPDCEPLRAILRKLEKARESLEKWKV
ncbi:DUF5623 domain-containing protein [Rhizobiales bacterium]|uniref:DUF5623 domain-containing protein n=1 Tax=Hongsoonwoonella zoysiae TaxID=2821844 RepID=UPI001561AA42|nr:DUF5623 domain-containing protein [Hongsoonwoonella zoysiae]NRG18654.1 DUF5623 domain-containing protein [Hongsoonwoonella zoysiae]